MKTAKTPVPMPLRRQAVGLQAGVAGLVGSLLAPLLGHVGAAPPILERAVVRVPPMGVGMESECSSARTRRDEACQTTTGALPPYGDDVNNVFDVF